MSEPKTDELIKKLPEVAKNIFIPCKKCDANRYHRVIAHKSEKSAKVQCEICGSNKTFTLKKAKKAAAKKASGTRKATSRKKQYDSLLSDIGTDNKKSYSMSAKFEVNTAMDHVKFGLGFVTEVSSLKVQVVFEDETRELVHNRS